MWPSLVVRDARLARDDTVILDGASFDVRAGELHGLIGPNGAGKTSLLEVIAGTVRASGTVATEAEDDVPRRQRRRHVFYVPDGITPFREERLAAVLDYVARSLSVDAGVVGDFVQKLDLEGVLHRPMRALSKGERKRALVALGLLTPQDFLLIDEPFDGLDLRQAASLREVLRAHTDSGRGILCSIHQLHDAETLCDRITLLHRGRTVASGTLAELRARAGLPTARLDEVFLALT